MVQREVRQREAFPERSKAERGSEGPGWTLSAGAYTVLLMEREDLNTSLLLCPGKISMKTKIHFIYSALFDNVFEALNLLSVFFFYIYVEEIQPNDQGIWILSIAQSFG